MKKNNIENKQLQKIKEEIDEMINKNGWKAINTGEIVAEYKPISDYKKELNISAQEANKVLEKLGYIEKEEKTKNIHLTKEGSKFGKEFLSFFTLKKSGGILTISKSIVKWNKKIIDIIKRYLKGGKTDE